RPRVETALKRRLCARAAKAPGAVPADLPEQIGRLLRRRCLEGLGLAKRAGTLAVGHDQVRASLESRRAVVLIQADDGSVSERERIAALGRGCNPELIVCRPLGSAELGEALGRATAVHLAVTEARMADRLLRDLQRLAEYELPDETKMPLGASGAPVE
ncbi:MAG: ribosomal L7Ae/L30e/S12e/Gadd45 family protein, partial [Tistlia sp.]